MNGKNLPATGYPQTPAMQMNSVAELIESKKSLFEMALGSKQMADLFVRTAVSALRQAPRLGQCDSMSLLGALMNAAQLSLFPNTPLGQAYIIPYWSTKRNCYEAQFQIGYQGYIELFYRHSLSSKLFVETVYEKDVFKYRLGTDRYIEHEPNLIERGKVIGYYGYASLKTGAEQMIFMSVADVERWRDHYAKADKSGNYGVWDSNFDEMALKTCVKRVLKYMPRSIEVMRILDADESVKRPINDKELIDIDMLPNRIEYNEAPADELETPSETPQEPKKPAKKADKVSGPEAEIDPKTMAKIDELMALAANSLPYEEADEWVNAIRTAGNPGSLANLESKLRIRLNEVNREAN